MERSKVLVYSHGGSVEVIEITPGMLRKECEKGKNLTIDYWIGVHAPKTPSPGL